MNILIVPYDGESAELTQALKKYKVTMSMKECKGGSCPISKPLKMMSAPEIKKSIANAIDSVANVKQISVLSLNEKDLLILAEMSRVDDWGNMKKGVTVKITT